jgi:hypothetical protein
MTVPHRTTAIAIASVASLGALLIAAAAATAQPAPDPPYPGPASPTSPPTVVIVHNGSPCWTFVLVAIAAAAATLLVAWLVSRIRHHTAAVPLTH